MVSPTAATSKVLLISLFTARLVADAIRGFLVAAMASTSVFVYVVAWLAFSSSCASTYTIVAVGVSRLSVSVFVYMLVAVRSPDTVTVDDVIYSVAVADELA